MAYTGTDPDGGVGYVTADSPDVRSILKRRAKRYVAELRNIL